MTKFPAARRPAENQESRAASDTYSATTMSLVSGPGRGGQNTTALPEELALAVNQHVKYIQQLDTVRDTR